MVKYTKEVFDENTESTRRACIYKKDGTRIDSLACSDYCHYYKGTVITKKSCYVKCGYIFESKGYLRNQAKKATAATPASTKSKAKFDPKTFCLIYDANSQRCKDCSSLKEAKKEFEQKNK